MRRLPALWLLPFVVASGVITARRVGCPDCIDRTRDNPRCEWVGDTRFHLDAHNPAHQRHLVSDAQLAEEVAIRYADAEHGRLYGFEGHGGLIDQGRVVNACMARLASQIQSNHRVTGQQIQRARAQRSLAFDVMASALFAPLYWLGATLLARGVYRRFSADERYVRLVALGVASIAFALVAVQVLELWLEVWEAMRVGNGHLSGFRAATDHRWPQQHLAAVFMGGIAGCWFVAWLGHRIPWIVTIASATLACAILAAEFFQRFPVR